MGFEKGKSGNPNGRPKGTPNKATVELKDAILGALDQGEGAQAYFLRLKEERPELFTQLVGKIIPKDVNVAVDAALTVTITRSFVKAEEKP